MDIADLRDIICKEIEEFARMNPEGKVNLKPDLCKLIFSRLTRRRLLLV